MVIRSTVVEELKYRKCEKKQITYQSEVGPVIRGTCEYPLVYEKIDTRNIKNNS